ncbi:hypothetical protein KKG29_03005 [Patescibacteria group bacterium]|nr:hypothetical protein [Patescibacteria group bacterium]MBU4000118.1 hypothetical protein [Patescibacteria group bacterium]MBU4368988.1 hypothetical protein [Patescibacteria group bacterium]
MGIEIEFGTLFLLLLLGVSIFGKFEVEAPVWKTFFKWLFVAVVTIALYGRIGHWSLVIPIVLSIVGLVVHFWWCHKHHIHPFRATPRKTYYQLRGWRWED